MRAPHILHRLVVWARRLRAGRPADRAPALADHPRGRRERPDPPGSWHTAGGAITSGRSPSSRHDKHGVCGSESGAGRCGFSGASGARDRPRPLPRRRREIPDTSRGPAAHLLPRSIPPPHLGNGCGDAAENRAEQDPRGPGAPCLCPQRLPAIA